MKMIAPPAIIVVAFCYPPTGAIILPARKFASVKFNSTFVETAREEAQLLHRSVAGQIEHWAKLGRAVESAPGFTLDRVRAALEGRFSVDDLAAEDQESFFDLLSNHFDTPSPTADAFYEARREGGGGVGRDEQGRLVRALPGGKSDMIG